MRWNSFCSKKRKTNLISTLVHKALAICSQYNLQVELTEIKLIYQNNGSCLDKKVVRYTIRLYYERRFTNRKVEWCSSRQVDAGLMLVMNMVVGGKFCSEASNHSANVCNNGHTYPVCVCTATSHQCVLCVHYNTVLLRSEPSLVQMSQLIDVAALSQVHTSSCIKP